MIGIILYHYKIVVKFLSDRRAMSSQRDDDR